MKILHRINRYVIMIKMFKVVTAIIKIVVIFIVIDRHREISLHVYMLFRFSDIKVI